jgi:ABC-type multidrug transport system ATPase subunit
MSSAPAQVPSWWSKRELRDQSGQSGPDEHEQLQTSTLTRGLKSSAASESQVRFSFTNCSYTVKVLPNGQSLGSAASAYCTKTIDRVLLRDISCVANGGEVLAIMGPSGAGKTTLLRMLTLERAMGSPFGNVTLNGHQFTVDLYTKYCAMVEQKDTLWEFLTAREHLEYGIAFCSAARDAEGKKERCNELMRQTGLESCQVTRAGRLSGGQRRRLSLAVALAKEPLIVFLDEVTTGLDAAGAANIIKLLKEVAVRSGAVFLSTVHQPSSNVFAAFDQTLFLSRGRTAYLGRADGVVRYLASIGRPMPPRTNPADFMLDVINSDFCGRAEVDEVLDAWAANAPALGHVAPTDLPLHVKTPLAQEVKTLLVKHGRLLVLDPTYCLMPVWNSVIGLFFPCLLFIASRKREAVRTLLAPSRACAPRRRSARCLRAGVRAGPVLPH